MTIKEKIGDQSYERLRRLIGASFPDTANVTDDMVDDFVRAMWRNYTPEMADAGIPQPEQQVQSFAEEEPLSGATFPMYIAHARHTRSLAMGSKKAMDSDFIGHLPVVRVGLPDSIPKGKEEVIKTQLGDVLLSADHLVGSIDMITEKYGDAGHLGYRPERVDLITPARSHGARFGAIALYLGYRGLRDPAPSFYLLEAGTATGAAKVLFFGRSTDAVITQTSWYQPTPFASPKNKYRGWVRCDGGDPISLVVEDSEPGQPQPYINVTVQYEKVSTPPTRWPADLILEAAQRVAAIAEAMGVPSGEPMEGMLAAVGRTLKWLHAPALGGTKTSR